jgi:hypothetical protein
MIETVRQLSFAVFVLAGLEAATLAAFFHLRRRHRLCREALYRTRRERDQARWALTNGKEGVARLESEA